MPESSMPVRRTVRNAARAQGVQNTMAARSVCFLDQTKDGIYYRWLRRKWKPRSIAAKVGCGVDDVNEVLVERVERLEGALRPFAQEHSWGPKDRFEIVLASQYGSIAGADLDAACAILKETDHD